MPVTNNLRLSVTPQETNRTFLDWRLQQDGPEDSNMTKLDAAWGDMKTMVDSAMMAVGHANTAATKAAMTDTDKVYIYVGSGTGADAGMQNGNWYYYDGTEWVSGGVYNATALQTDKSLTQDGEAADAKTTGEKFTNLDTLLDIETASVEGSGTVVALNNMAAGAQVSHLVVGVEATQSGSGTPSSSNYREITGATSITVKRRGKNLFDKTPNQYLSYKVGYSGNSTDTPGTLESVGTPWAWVELPGGVTYTVTCSSRTSERFAVISSPARPTTGGVMSKCVRNNNADSLVFEAPEGTTWIGIQVAYNKTDITDYVDKLQIEVGSTATDYEAFSGSTVTDNLSNPIYAGTADIAAGTVTSTGVLLTLTGSESWTSLGSGSGMYFRTKIGDPGTIHTDWGISTVLPMASTDLLSSNTDVGFRIQPVTSDSNNIYLCVRPDPSENITTRNGFTSWLSTLNNNQTPMKVLYKLVTGNSINITAQTITTTSGTNTFLHNGEVISVSVSGSISSGALSGKQDKLTFDAEPTENSTNPVTSGGVYEALSDCLTLESMHTKLLLPTWMVGNVANNGQTNTSAGYAHTSEMIESPYVMVRVTDYGRTQYNAYINRVALYDGEGNFIAANDGAGTVHASEVYTLDKIYALSPENQVRVAGVKVAVFIDNSVITAETSVADITSIVNSCFTIKCIPVGNDANAVRADEPENEGVYNTLLNAWQQSQITFTTTAGFPQQNAPSQSTPKTYPAGTTVTGLPYSATRSTANHIPEYVTYETFMTAVANPNSYVYTRREATSNGLTYYGSICHVFCRYSLNILDLYSATAWDEIPGMELLQPQSHQAIKLGDMFVIHTDALIGHVLMVTGILRDSKGRIQSVTLSESGGTGCHSATMTINSLISSYPVVGEVRNNSGNVYDIYRYSLIAGVKHRQIPYVAVGDETPQNYTINPNLGLRKGNRSNWLTSETVEIDVMSNGGGTFTGYEVKKYGIPVYGKSSIFKNGNIRYDKANYMGAVNTRQDSLRNYSAFAKSEYPSMYIKSDGTLKFTVFSYSSATINTSNCLNDLSSNQPYQTTAEDFVVTDHLVSGATHYAIMVELAENDGIARGVEEWKNMLLERFDMFTSAPTTTTGTISSLSTASGTRVDGTTLEGYKVISLSGLTAGSYRARLTGSNNSKSGWVDWMMVSLVETIVDDPNVTGGVTVDVECSNNAIPMVVQWTSSNSIQNLSRTVITDYTRDSSSTTAHLSSVYSGFRSDRNPYGIRTLVKTDYGVICAPFAWDTSRTPNYDTDDRRWVRVT